MINRNIFRLLAAVLLGLMMCIVVCAVECEQHDFQMFEVAPNCDEPGYRGYQCCVCGQLSQMESIEQLGHDLGDWKTIVYPSCSKEGVQQAQCSRCSYVKSRPIATEEHDYRISTVAPTCTKDGYTLHKCETCADEMRLDPTPKLGHTFSEWLVEPTCKQDGYTLHTCTVCGHEEKTDRVKSLGHNFVAEVTAPTCTADGYTRHKCANCGDAYRTDPVEKTGHQYNNGIITKEPTWTTMGRKTYTCRGCADSYTVTTPKLTNPFADVWEGSYYYDGVIWAVGMEITNGISDTKFAPETTCTRGQIVTFLWREAGQPNPESTSCPFVDISQDAYYYEAVLWAVEQGITNGIDQTHFAPERSCTRCQVVTFLHRAKGLPRPKTGCGFWDVRPTDYFHDAVCWASGENITTGTGANTFSPNDACTRGQIVTFLHRAKGK